MNDWSNIFLCQSFIGGGTLNPPNDGHKKFLSKIENIVGMICLDQHNIKVVFANITAMYKNSMKYCSFFTALLPP